MMNLFSISIDSALIRVGLMGLILLVASLNIEYSYSIFNLSLSSSKSTVGYYFITCVGSIATLVTCSSGNICGNVNLFNSAY